MRGYPFKVLKSLILLERRPDRKPELEDVLRLELLLSTPARAGCTAKIRRNGTFRTGMKKRTSAPVDVLNAACLPTTCVVPPVGALGSMSSPAVAKGSTIVVGGGIRTTLSSHHENGSPKSLTWPAS